jgi:hypothetical protein
MGTIENLCMHASTVCLRRVAVNHDTGATVVLAEGGQGWYDEGHLAVARPSRWQPAHGPDVEGKRHRGRLGNGADST